MPKIYDIVATTGEYQTRDGQTKKRFTNIGAVFQTKNGMSMKLESVPIGWNGWASFYEPKERAQPQERRSSGSGVFGANEDIPF